MAVETRRIDQLDPYLTVDTSKATQDLYEVSKNTGTAGSPLYEAGGSRKITAEKLKESLNIKDYVVRDFVVKNSGDTIEEDKVNAIIVTADTSFTLPTASTSNYGKPIVIANRSNYTVTINGIVNASSGSIKLTNFNEVSEFTCLFDGVSTYGWWLLADAITDKICSNSVVLSASTYLAKHNDSINANAQSVGSNIDITIPTAGIFGRLIYVYYPSGSPSAFVVNLIGGFSATLAQLDYFLIRDNGSYWEAISTSQNVATTPDLDAVTTEGNTTTNDITVGSVTASNASDSTLAFIDSAKKLVSALGTTFGTWLNGLTAKSTVVDADVITTLDSVSSFEAKKTTLAQFWTNYLLAKVQALGYALSTDVTTVDWNTNANYTITNTTAKYLVVQQTGTFTAPRTITLSTLPAGSTLVIQGGASITATNTVSIGSFVNGVSSYANALTLAFQSLTLYSLGGGFYTTNKPQFSETTTALSTSKYLRSSAGIGLNTVSSFTPSWATGASAGDLNWQNVASAILARSAGGDTIPFMAFAPFTGWQNYRPTTLQYFNGQNIASGNKPTEYGSGSGSIGFVQYWSRSYIVRCYGESTDNYLEVLIYVNGSGVPSIVRVLQESSVFSITLSGGTLQFAGGNAYVCFEQVPQQTTTNLRGIYNWVYQQGGTDVRFQGNLALGSSTINARSQLHLQATNKGFLPNVLTTAQRDAVSWVAGDAGMIIYNSTTNKHQGWNGTTWNDMY